MKYDLKKIANDLVLRKYGKLMKEKKDYFYDKPLIYKIKYIENSNGVFFEFEFSIEDERSKYCMGHIYNGQIFYGIEGSLSTVRITEE